MKLKINFLISAFIALILFNGCSKDIEEYNKPAIYWYTKMIDNISSGNLEQADDYYSSLEGEHIGSPLLPEATMILAIAHMYDEEYLLSEHFLDEYIKRYANLNEKEFAEFLKIRAKYKSLPNPRRDQSLIGEAIVASQKFEKNYPHSMYYGIVDTMLTRLYLAESALNKNIADLYDRLDKPKAAAFYRAMKPRPWIKWDDINRAGSPWYREWFEGDGSESWYAFMIPDTQSVVSRNTIQDDENEEQKEKSTLTPQQQSQMKQIKNLQDNGALSEEEFNKLKNEILDNMPMQEEQVPLQDENLPIKEDNIEKPSSTLTQQQQVQMKQIEELLDNGALSEEEFNKLKNEILGK